MKKLLVVLLAVVMVFAFATSAFAYTDTDELSRVERDAIYGLSALGILEGYGEGVFGPELTVTRAEMAKITCYLGGFGETASNYVNTATRYSDVPATHWAAGYIAAADSYGYVKGYPDGTFKPSQTVSMQEALTMMLRVAGYTDELPGPWPFDYIAQGAKLGVTDDVSFTGTAAGRRANIAVMGWNLLDQTIVYYNEVKGTFTAIDWSTFGDVYYGNRLANPTVMDNFDNARIVTNAIIADWFISDFDEKEVSIAVLADIAWANFGDQERGVSIAGRALADDAYISDGLYFHDIEGYTAKVFYDKDPAKTDAQIIYIGLENEVKYSDDVEVRDASRNVIRVDGKEVATVGDKVLYYYDGGHVWQELEDMADVLEQGDDGAYKLWYNRSGKLYAVEELPDRLEILVFDEYDKEDEYVYGYFGDGKLRSIDVEGKEVAIVHEGKVLGLEDLKAGEVLAPEFGAFEWAGADSWRGVDAVLYYPEILSGKLKKATSTKITIGESAYNWDDDSTFVSSKDFKEYAELEDPDQLDDAYDETVKYILINPYKVGYIAYAEPAATTKTVYGIVEDADMGAAGRVRELTIRNSEDKRVRYDMDYIINWGDEEGDLHAGAFVELKVTLADNVIDEVVKVTPADEASFADSYAAANAWENYVAAKADGDPLTVDINKERMDTEEGYLDILDSTIVFNVFTDEYGDFEEAIAITGKDFRTVDEFECDAYLAKYDKNRDLVVVVMLNADVFGGYNYGLLTDVTRTSSKTKVTIGGTEYVYDGDEEFADLSDLKNYAFVEFVVRDEKVIEITPIVNTSEDYLTGGVDTQYDGLFVQDDASVGDIAVVDAATDTNTIEIAGKSFTVNSNTQCFEIQENGKIKAIRRSSLGADGEVIAVLTNNSDDIVKFLFIYAWSI